MPPSLERDIKLAPRRDFNLSTITTTHTSTPQYNNTSPTNHHSPIVHSSLQQRSSSHNRQAMASPLPNTNTSPSASMPITPTPTAPQTTSAPTTTAETAASNASTYLSTFLNRTLHVHTTDGRMFAGQMKCTDPERNIILSMTHEYREPSTGDVALAAERAGRSGSGSGKTVKVDMKKRFVGLVVVPGKYIRKIEVEG
jgi:small nuclear ribonucleoprotein (snRNP)-like protein